MQMTLILVQYTLIYNQHTLLLQKLNMEILQINYNAQCLTKYISYSLHTTQ